MGGSAGGGQGQLPPASAAAAGESGRRPCTAPRPLCHCHISPPLHGAAARLNSAERAAAADFGLACPPSTHCCCFFLSPRRFSEPDLLPLLQAAVGAKVTLLSTTKRPRSAYLFFLADFRSRHVGMRQRDVCAAAGAAWRSMDEEQRAPYEAEAERTRAEWRGRKERADGGGDGRAEARSFTFRSEMEVGNASNDSASPGGSREGLLPSWHHPLQYPLQYHPLHFVPLPDNLPRLHTPLFNGGSSSGSPESTTPLPPTTTASMVSLLLQHGGSPPAAPLSPLLDSASLLGLYQLVSLLACQGHLGFMFPFSCLAAHAFPPLCRRAIWRAQAGC